MSAFTLERLEEIVAQRAGTSDGTSYTRQLVEAGPARCAKKLGEEAVEAALAAVGDSREELIKESADVLYHLLVVLAVRGIALDEVYAELERRTVRSGLAEKAARSE